MKAIGICNLHDGPHLGQLTKHHPLGVVTFLGRYGLMDFTLSNFSNSGIDKVIVLAESDIRQIRSHLRSGNVWINNTRTGYQSILFNEKGATLSTKFNTDINNILASFDAFEDLEEDYIVVAPPFFLTPLDFREVIKAHEKSGKEVTIVYKHVDNADKKFFNCDEINIDKNTNCVDSFALNNCSNKEADISLETFVFNKNTFLELVKMTKTVSSLYSLRKMVVYGLNHGLFGINAYETKDVVLPILTFQDYVDESMNLLDHKNRSLLFKEDWPIYTTTHNTPPSMFGGKADVKNSFIANGSVVKGKVENCIISRNVVIGEGAVVKNSILFYKTEIGENANLEHVLTDKYVKVLETKELVGEKDNVLYIEFGERV